VITRSVRDSAAALDIIAPQQKGAPLHAPMPSTSFLAQLVEPLPKLRVAYVQDPFFSAELHEDCRSAALDAARLCESLGHMVEPAKIEIDADQIAHAYTVVVSAETDAAIQNLAREMGRQPKLTDLEPLTHICSLGGRAFSASDYARAIGIMDETRRKVATTFDGYDVVLTPTLALPPPQIGQLDQTLLEAALLKVLRRCPSKALLKFAFRQIPKSGFRFTPYTALFNLTGQPAMSVPLYWNARGLPIGSHFVAEFGEEGLLLRLAKQLDLARPFSSRRPLVSATVIP
jgi:amidase